MAQAITGEHVTVVEPSGKHATPRRLPWDDWLAPDTRMGSWRIADELGRGGMAAVYAATDAQSGEPAAIKIVHDTLLDERYTAETFLREAEIIRKVSHPGVIEIWSTGHHGDRPYLVMEQLSGETLGQLRERGPLPRADALEILLELCDILRASHEAGIVHRDLKLDNVFILDKPYDGRRRVKLLDWGVAHVDDEADPFRGLIAGTLTYVAPEQIRGERLTGACDIYSLGVIAYQLLCGVAPFAATTDLKLVHMHLHAEPPRPRETWRHVPEELDAVLHAMLAKHPKHRPSIDEVVRALRETGKEIAPIRDTWHDVPSERTPTPRLPWPPSPAGWLALAFALAGVLAVLGAWA